MKQFRNHDARSQLRRLTRGSRAQSSFDTALAVRQAGVLTPEPLFFLDSEVLAGPSLYVCSHLEDALEVRYLLRAINAETHEEQFPHIDVVWFLRALGRLARTLHDHDIWHRDFTSGNVLLCPEGKGCAADENRPDLYLVDLNRARVGRTVAWSARARELGRMPVFPEAMQEHMLEGYLEAQPVPGGVILERLRERYRFHHRGFLLKNQSKQQVRGSLRRAQDLLLPRRKAHVHIPEAEEGAGLRDRVVWDPLSDQPQSARFEDGEAAGAAC